MSQENNVKPGLNEIMWNRKFKACSFAVKMSSFHAVKMSSFHSAISVYKFVFCSYSLFFNNSKKLHQKETLSQVFSCGFWKVFRTLLQNTSAWLLLKCYWEEPKKFSREWKTPYYQPRRSLTGFKMGLCKKAEKCWKQGDAKILNNWIAESHKRNWQIFMNHRTDLKLLFCKVITLNRNPY